MNYKRIYYQLILKCTGRLPGPDQQLHHILPINNGGSNDLSNMVYMTRREHSIAHLLLYKINGNTPDASAATLIGGTKHKPKKDRLKARMLVQYHATKKMEAEMLPPKQRKKPGRKPGFKMDGKIVRKPGEKTPLTNAEKQKAYRARQKLLKQVKDLSQQTTDK